MDSLYWYHSIDLGRGVVTPGARSAESLAQMLGALDLPDLRGKTVLDIGTWDGYFAFECERRGASRVVALDHFVWSWRRSAGGRALLDDPDGWQPDELPTKRAFDLAHSTLGSAVEPVVADFIEMDVTELGRFDVVLYLGVLYHMQDPLGALRRVAQVTDGVAVIETQAIAIAGLEQAKVWEFYEDRELNDDPTNWWAPNLAALGAACRAAGFAEVKTKVGPPALEASSTNAVHAYRAIVHALH